jgi:hypothetical protein
MCQHHTIHREANSLRIPEELAHEKPIQVKHVEESGNEVTRLIIPVDIYWGSLDQNSNPEWIIKVWDIESVSIKEYALKDMQEWVR